MAITSLDGIIAGFQVPKFFYKAVTGTLVAGRPRSLWGLAGIPGPGSYDTTLNGVTLTSPVDGQIPFDNPSSGYSYLSRFVGLTNQASTLVVCDRIWHNGNINITSTSPQSITSPTWPSRDVDGSTNGKGIFLAVEVSSATGANTPTLTVGYTNSAGTNSRTGTNILATVSSAPAGTFYIIGLQAGDVGVRSVESITLSSSWTSGTINLVAYRILGLVSQAGTATPSVLDPVTGGFPRCFTGTVPFVFIIPSTTTSSNTIGQFVWSNG